MTNSPTEKVSMLLPDNKLLKKANNVKKQCLLQSALYKFGICFL